MGIVTTATTSATGNGTGAKTSPTVNVVKTLIDQPPLLSLRADLAGGPTGLGGLTQPSGLTAEQHVQFQKQLLQLKQQQQLQQQLLLQQFQAQQQKLAEQHEKQLHHDRIRVSNAMAARAPLPLIVCSTYLIYHRVLRAQRAIEQLSVLARLKNAPYNRSIAN